jgi:hypothetical protein
MRALDDEDWVSLDVDVVSTRRIERLLATGLVQPA